MQKYDKEYAANLVKRLNSIAEGMEKLALETMTNGAGNITLKTARGNTLTVEQAVNRAQGIRDACEFIMSDRG